MNEKLTPKPLVVMPPVMLAVLAVFLSLAWLIPNHTRPWLAFYSDAIAGIVLLAVAIWVLFRSPGKLQLVGFGLFFLLIAAVPWLQFVAGIVYSLGTAWINSLYLVGFSLAIFAGWHWEKSTPGQCLDFLFLAIILAAVVSVGMQCVQWFHQGSGSEWVIAGGTSRFYANMAQPNQLASLLLLAVVGAAWGYARKTLGALVASTLVWYLLSGVALTESRTAWINVAGILIALYCFWGERRPKYFNRALLGFGAYFFALYFTLPALNDWRFGEAAVRRELADPIRLGMWKSLFGALMERPWFGYGWGQTTEAVFFSKDFPNTGVMMMHAHNIVLDLLLYNGILLGGIVLVILAAAFFRLFAHLKTEYLIIPILAISILLVHSMLELPLHYAYFLLPFGMILGGLGQAIGLRIWAEIPKWLGLGGSIFFACALFITIADYLEVERTFLSVKGKRNQSIPPEDLPKLLVLIQWEDRLKLANSEVERPLSFERYRWMSGVVISTPNPALIFKFAQNLALNERPNEARKWLQSLCKIIPEQLGRVAANEWAGISEANESYRNVGWGSCEEAR